MMLRVVAACLVAVSAAASAAPTTYTFRGFAERSSGSFGYRPYGANYGQLIPIMVTLDPATPPASVSGNTAVYGGSCFGYPAPADPIKGAVINGKPVGPGCFDTVTVQSNPGGLSSITIQSGSPQVGGFRMVLTTPVAKAVPDTAIPPRIDTLMFQSATFNVSYVGADIEGDMVSR